MPRPPDFDLAAALASPSFTPAQRDAPALAELTAAGNDRAAVALATLGDVARHVLVDRLRTPDEAARAHLVRALGVLARRGDPPALALVIDQLADASSRVRRAAINSLGKLGAVPAIDVGRAALVARWDALAVPPDERRALAEALGKLGGTDALSRLRELAPGDDAELARRRDRALLVADRTAKRGTESSIRDDLAPPSPVAVTLRCKPGLAGVLVDELRAHLIDARALADAAVETALVGPWRALWVSRLWMTAGVRVPRPPIPDVAASVAAGLVAAIPLLTAWTTGPIRWRLDLPGGKQRAVVWRVAKAVAAAAPQLVNDPTATTWDVVVDDTALELRPRRMTDPRFAYRAADVPAASHPTVAAALAFVAEARSGDRVWDPFVGSGLELIERARLGPARSLAGTDVAPAALEAARANLAAAGVTATLELGDTLAATGAGDLDLVLTNPPLGSRVQLDAATLLCNALPIIARRLAPGGRLVWITPATARTTKVAERLGLRRARSIAVDLGGVRGQLERWDRAR